LISTSFIDPHALDRDWAPGFADVTTERLRFYKGKSQLV
jgi:hypothetical protein